MSQTAESATPALAESRELFETVLRHLHDGIVVLNTAGELVYVNEAGARLSGYSTAADMLAAPPGEARARFQIFDATGEPLPPERLPGRRALAGDDPEPMIVRFRSGAELPDRLSEVRAVGVRDAGGAVQYAISFFREVTNEVARSDEQRAAADQYAELYREAQRTTALLDALYGAAPVGLGFWDRDLRYVRVNEKLAEINERPAQDHVGRTFAEVVPQLAHVLEPMARRVLDRRESVIALEVTAGSPSRPEEQRHWLASYYPVLAADGQALGVGCVLEEITERRRAEQRTALQLEVTEVLAVADATADAVPRVLQTVCETLGWDVACYWSTDPDHPPVTWARPGNHFDGFIALTTRAALSSAMLAGRVAESGKAEWLAEIHRSTFARGSVAAAEGLKSGVAFPVLVEGEVVGVLEAFSSARAAEDTDLMQTLTAIGAQLGQFLRRKRAEDERQQLLHRERIARAEAEAAVATLRKLGRVSEAALEHSSLAGLLDSLLTRIVEVLEADTAAILLVEDDGALHLRAAVGLGAEVARAVAIPIGAGMAGRVAELRTPLLVPDLSQIELHSPVLRERGINSLVAIPLIVEERVIGVVHAGSVAFAQFVEDDARLLELIADRIAMAINQAALYEAERVAQDRLHFLGEASTLLASSLDVDATLARVAKLAVPHFADWCSVDLLDAAGAINRVAIEPVDPKQVDLAERIAAAIETGEAELSDKSIVVPLTARDRTLGALTFVTAESGRRYAAPDLQFAQELAARAAVAVDNAQLYREAEDRAQEARVLASVGDGVFLVDRNGLVRTWNRAAETATGLSAAAVVDRPAAEAIPGWAEIVTSIPIAAAGSAGPRAESLPLDLRGRELWLSIHGVVVADGVVYAFRDQTEERALEVMRTEFVSTVSHELRTPLAAIYGAAMTLRRQDVALNEQQRASLLDVVSGEADRLARTVNDILWASRLDTDTLYVTIQNCDLLGLARDVVEAQLAHLDPAHELVLIADADLPPVLGDPDKVGRVLINLVDNAIKYSPDGGRVNVAVKLAGSHVRFSVTDPGLGIPPAEQRRIFEKFYRLDPNMNRGVGGTGLGLYICRELVRRMQGRVWVDSDGLGSGSTFHVEFPVAGDFTAHLA
jgi:PAS domain S-box-containing protein